MVRVATKANPPRPRRIRVCPSSFIIKELLAIEARPARIENGGLHDSFPAAKQSAGGEVSRREGGARLACGFSSGKACCGAVARRGKLKLGLLCEGKNRSYGTYRSYIDQAGCLVVNLGRFFFYSNQPVFIAGVAELHGRFGARADMEFFVDMFQVNPDGFHADAEAVGDFLVGESFAELFKDLRFALR